MWQPT
jgi:hypothetical protein